MIRPSSWPLSACFVVVALMLLIPVHFHLSRQAEIRYQTPLSLSLKNHHSEACSAFSGLERVVITVKTGATEAPLIIPTQLQTSLQCAPYVYVFSDMAQKIGETQVYDALDTIPPEVTKGNPDFDIYREQQKLHDPERIVGTLRGSKSSSTPDELAAWTLDKYKNVHIVEKAWNLQPDMDWYLHIDADTYVLWSSLIAWTQKLDPSQESYLGALTYIDNTPFAHGGSGILLSNAATRDLVVTHNGTASRWDYKMRDNCCGDLVLAQALQEYGIEVIHSSPTLVGLTPNTIPFSPDYWCQPAVTLHHISPAQAKQLGKFEQRRKDKSAPVLFSEIFKDLIFDTIPDWLDDWDNLMEDDSAETVPGISSAQDCTAACAKNPKCFQSLYVGDECHLGTQNFRFGEKRMPDDGKTWQSSWNKTRIAAWVSKQKPCGNVTFPFQN